MKKINKLIFILIVCGASYLHPAAFAVSFPDVPRNHYAFDEITAITDHPQGYEMLSGNPNGTFNPDGFVNRAEMAKIASVYHSYLRSDSEPQKSQSFRDIPDNQWYSPFVKEAQEFGFVSGYADRYGNPLGYYGPEDNVSKAQALKILLEISKLGVEGEKQFEDVYPNDWYASYTKRGLSSGVLIPGENIRGAASPYFSPNQAITRSELAILLKRFIEITLNTDYKPDQGGVNITLDENINIYANGKQNFSIKAPKDFGLLKKITSTDSSYTFENIPDSKVMVLSLNDLYKKLSENDAYHHQQVISKLALKELNENSKALIEEKPLFFAPKSIIRGPIEFITFGSKTGYSTIAYDTANPNLSSYQHRTVMVKDTTIVHTTMPLFPWNGSRYEELNTAYQEKMINKDVQTTFFQSLQSRLSESNQPLAPLDRTSIMDLQDRYKKYLALPRTTTLTTQ